MAYGYDSELFYCRTSNLIFYSKMGKQERIKMDLAHKDEQVRIEKRKKRLIEDRDQKYFSLSQLKTTDKWTPAEEKEAIRKVAKVAFVYDRSKGMLVLLFCLFRL